MNLTFDPISKQPFFVGMIKMCHQVRSTRLRDDEVEKLFCSNASAQNKSFTIMNCKRSICQNWLSSHPLEGGNRGATNCRQQCGSQSFCPPANKAEGAKVMFIYLFSGFPILTKTIKYFRKHHDKPSQFSSAAVVYVHGGGVIAGRADQFFGHCRWSKDMLTIEYIEYI